jgi:hypothetical protein
VVLGRQQSIAHEALHAGFEEVEGFLVECHGRSPDWEGSRIVE